MAGQTHAAGTRRAFRLLLDSNVLFSAEPFAGEMEQRFAAVAELLRTASSQGHRVLVHPASLDDARADRDVGRRRQRLAELSKYETLEEVPVPSGLQAIFGDPQPGSRDQRDMRILAALPAHAATHLVTDDDRLRRRAARAGFGDAVLSVPDAIELLTDLVRPVAEPPPRVRRMQTYEIDPEQAIFDSVRADYPAGDGRTGFDNWLNKIRADHDNRVAFVIAHDGAYQAVALIKLVEDDPAYDFPPGTSKLSTFKVDPTAGGLKLGELLLKAVLLDAAERDCPGVFVEVHRHHGQLIGWLEDFGFVDTGQRTVADELVMHKTRIPATDDNLDDLQFHIAHGPPALRITAARIVPIEPRWFDQLFPDSPITRSRPLELPMFGEDTRPWGNALRKAYVSRRAHRKIRRGDVLLFYRSKDEQAVAALGVVEETRVSADPDELITFMGQRTVYGPGEIEEFCRRGDPVTAVIFRQDRFIEPPWPWQQLAARRVLRRPPQSIATVPEEGVQWLRTQLE
jgi:ribosomal protein S18 acetylase RimI-like enzyme